MVLSMTTVAAFAQTEQIYVDDAEQLKSLLQQGATAEDIKHYVTPEAVAEFMGEKLDLAAEIINGQEFTANMEKQADGSLYAMQSFDLGDGCQLIVELRDKDEVQANTGVYRTAVSTSSPQWYGYGNRQFTAKASVSCAAGNASMNLTNKYTLSANGIDERPGEASGAFIGNIISNTEPNITDRVARTPGASDVNMHCDYKLIEKGNSKGKIYRLNTTVGFVDINKSTKKIRVKESWSLTKVS